MGRLFILAENRQEKAEKNIQAQLLLDAIVLKEDVQVSDDEIEDEYKEIARQYNQEDSEEFINTVKKSLSPDYIKELVSKRKVVDMLVNNAVFIEAEEKEEIVEEEKEEETEVQED